jgi:hypothetical protein
MYIAVIPGREPCDKIDTRINFALGEWSRNDDHDNSFFYNASPFSSRGTSPNNPAA